MTGVLDKLPAQGLRDLPGRLILFGLLTSFASSVGQTFFIALSNSAFREAYDLTSSGLSLVYGAATMTSGVLMLVLGRLIDRVDLRAFTAVAALVAAGGAALVATGDLLPSLAVGLLMLRLGGQGLLSHAAAVSVARSSGRNRGKATSIALLGHAAGEALLPLVWAALVGLVAWRMGWATAAGLVLVAYLPLALLVLPATAHRVPPPEAGSRHAETAPALFRDRSFPALLLCAVLPGVVVTAVLFHLQPLAAGLPSTAPDPAVAIPAYAVGAVAGGLGAGVLVDSIGGRRTIVLGLIGLVMGCLLLMIPASFAALAVGLAAMGVATGFTHSASAPTWAETFGVHHVGRARSVQAFCMVAGTAISPVVYGLALDADVGTGMIMVGTAALVVGTLAWGALALRKR